MIPEFVLPNNKDSLLDRVSALSFNIGDIEFGLVTQLKIFLRRSYSK